jgi:hypothetical protein
MVSEKQEVKIKKALMDFINIEIQIAPAMGMTLEAGQIAVADRKYQLVELLFSLFKEFDKYVHPPKVDNPPKL